MAKADLYKYVKIGGMLSFIPFVMVTGPLGGYFLGSYLERRFGVSFYVTAICIILGFAGSARETIRIVRIVLKAEKDK